MTIEQWLRDVHYDKLGTGIWSRDKDGGNQMVADIRGWGAIQNLFNTPEEAEQFQDEVGEFITQAIKEKLSRLPQQEISDGGEDTADYIDRHLVAALVQHSIAIEISDEEIKKGGENAWSDYEYQEGNLYSTTFRDGWLMAIKWYREQLKNK